MKRNHYYGEIADSINQRPTDLLALGRTKMANERTLLSFIRTSVGFFGRGIELIKFIEHAFIVAAGWVLVLTGGVFLIWGIKRYFTFNRLLKKLMRS